MRRRRVRRLFAVAVIVALVSSAAILPGLAQAQADDESDTGVSPPGDEAADSDGEDDDGEDNESDDDDEQASGGNEGGGNDDASETGPSGTVGTGNGLAMSGSADSRSAGDFLDGTAEWVREGADAAIQSVIEGTLAIVVGAPTMDNSGWLGIFGTPTEEPTATLFDELHEAIIFPLTLSFVGASVLVVGGLLPFGSLIGRYNATRWIGMVFVLIFAIGLSWPFVSGLHALFDALGTSIAPTAEQLTTTDNGLATLGSVSAPAAGGIYLFGWGAAIAYALIYGMRYFLLLMIMPYVFPLALALALAAPWRKLRALGSGILWLHAGLLIAGLPPAILYRGAYEVGWEFGVQGLENLLLVIGLVVAGVVIPIVIMKQMIGMMGVVSATAAGAGSALATRSSYRPRSIGHARRAGARARDIGRSASSRAHSAAQTVASRRPMTGGGTTTQTQTRTSSESGSRSASRGTTGRSTGNSGTTQAVQRRKINNIGVTPMNRSTKPRKRLRKTTGGWTVEDR